MATLTEIGTLINDSVLAEKCRAAMLITAYNVKTESAGTANHAARLALVKQWLTDPDGWDNRVARYVIGANNTSTLAEIQGLSDASIKAHVDASLDVFI